MKKYDDNIRNEIQGNYPTGSIEVTPDKNLKKICDALSYKLDTKLKKALIMHSKITGINTQKVKIRAPYEFELRQKTLRETIISEKYTGGIPTFFWEYGKSKKDKKKQIKPEFMIGALQVLYKNDIKPVRLLAISGDYPLYDRIDNEKTAKFTGFIRDIELKDKNKKIIEGKVTGRTSVIVKAAIEGFIKDGPTETKISYRIKGTIDNPTRLKDDSPVSGIISGGIYKGVGQQERKVAEIDNLPLVHNDLKGQITIDTSDDKKLFEFEYNGFKLINDPDFHKMFFQLGKPAHNLSGEQLETKLSKSCAAQKLFAYLNLETSKSRDTRRRYLKNIKSIGMYETFYVHPGLKPQTRDQSTIHPVDSCDECKKILPILTRGPSKNKKGLEERQRKIA